ncbi:MAG: metallophosphoesterase [Enterocloster citroniae]|nr:metallophosphoesterase [Enterocloster citroniae]
MKKKTWIISALMYAMVFMACFGVLHFMKKLMEPAGPVQTEATAKGPGPASAGDDHRKRPEDGTEDSRAKTATDSQAEKPEEVIREEGYTGWKKQFPGLWTPPQDTQEPYVPPKLVLATDLHYQSAQAGDGGPAFQLFVERSDGKVIQYLPELLEAFLDEVIEEKPSALVLSGDITMNGERMNHEELAGRLARVQDAGVQVLVIPGNHDINNGHAAVYYGAEKESVDSIDGEDFYEIYRRYGYDQALSRDSSSLSYVYALDEKNWLLMLDSCQYEPENKVEGRIKESTLAWMDEQLLKAREQGIFVLPIAHHNLLAQSRMYTTQCAMDNNSEVIDLLQKYRLPLFFSGHLHVQRVRKHKAEPGVDDGAYGIQEIITDALSIPPCQYGEVVWDEDGSISYETRSVDVSGWARKTGSGNPDLLDFEDWSYRYIQKLISDQIRGVVQNLGEDVERSMAATYAGVYIDYYAGRKIDAKGIRNTKGYRWWQRNMPDSYLLRELDSMITDSDRDNNYFLLPEEEGWLRE